MRARIYLIIYVCVHTQTYICLYKDVKLIKFDYINPSFGTI